MSTGRAAWTWESWADWHERAIGRRNWRKTPLRRMLELRDNECRCSGDTYNYYAPHAVSGRNGMIYGAYHFPTGKWYVGQTINTVRQRAREHWWARNSADDFLHLTLADDPDPMSWVAFPLEGVPKELWCTPLNARRAGWRKLERAKFRAVATPRERFWVDKLHSMWPKGWNSQYPGKPASSRHLAARPAGAVPPRDPARDVEAAKKAMRAWEADPRAARATWRGATRVELGEILEGLQKGLPPAQQTPVTVAIAVEVREALRKRKLEKKPRDFVRFLFGNDLAADMDLPNIFRDPAIYSLHPEPDVAAAIMVCHRFAPQIASDLFNYKDWSMRPQPLGVEDAGTCPCHTVVLPGTELVEGHILSTEPGQLASPYLRDILAKGKKYRLQQPVASVLARVNEGLAQYTAHKKKGNDDPDYHEALENWAAAVVARAQLRLSQAAIARAPEPEGYPGLKQQLRAAKNALVFGPEDRAPHAMFFACGRLYQARLHQRLTEARSFELQAGAAEDVLEGIRVFNEGLGLLHHNRLPYLYGAWKAKKKAFRWIAGTSRVQDAPSAQGAPKPTNDGPPKNALTEVGCLMTKVLQHVLRSLRSKDVGGRSGGGPTRYWVIEDIDEFVQEFRAMATAVAKVPWATYDFTTMYEALEHAKLTDGVVYAVTEAWRSLTKGKKYRLQQPVASVLARVNEGLAQYTATRRRGTTIQITTRRSRTGQPPWLPGRSSAYPKRPSPERRSRKVTRG